MIDGRQNDTEHEKGNKQGGSVQEDPHKSELCGIDEGIGIGTKSRAAQNNIKEVKNRVDEPPKGDPPTSSSPLPERQTSTAYKEMERHRATHNPRKTAILADA
jgi:hypothetical protein